MQKYIKIFLIEKNQFTMMLVSILYEDFLEEKYQ